MAKKPYCIEDLEKLETDIKIMRTEFRSKIKNIGPRILAKPLGKAHQYLYDLYTETRPVSAESVIKMMKGIYKFEQERTHD